MKTIEQLETELTQALAMLAEAEKDAAARPSHKPLSTYRASPHPTGGNACSRH